MKIINENTVHYVYGDPIVDMIIDSFGYKLEIEETIGEALVVKFWPILSLIILKKHLTSSVLEALGCSGFQLLDITSLRCHSWPSMLVIRATKVSFENPNTLFKHL